MSNRKTTWRRLITERMERAEETWTDLVQMTLTEDQLDTEFDAGWGGPEGVSFTLWTAKRVYFPVMYDGSEWVDCVPRNPCSHATSHVGGG